ncbi:MAG: pyridine nucleotide-disulfide oxidoreductase [Gammaproteobacteria bacterium]|jgi:hypothetical protein|nr:pyridine nucleotide-disulfide oxidoreductase [Gammaproteobacteria bacterium]MDH3749160.1 pyridine nucleotide-disulfide oxidoreductase [Gammaproteobacteria bacterium]MDH3804198.1 pyridine nucleotide-disulfide oxidoreductase [Gammaproteobacteria bacterium]
MNEIVLDRVFETGNFRTRLFGTAETRQSSTFYGYTLTLIAIGLGWLLRGYELIDPKDGLGYWLGIIGGSMMLILILYPLRKRIRALRFLGRTAHWFQIHIVLGVLGPVLVLYHSNFSLGSFNSQVALYCMLAVAVSGVIGKYLYAHIHNGLYGGKASLKDLRDNLAESLENSHGLATLLPRFTSKLEALAAEAQGCSITGKLSMRVSLSWSLRKYAIWISLSRAAHRELQAHAVASPAVARDFDKLKKATSTYIRNFVQLTTRVAQFTLFERLSSLWHVLHMPLFLMMVISALLHVLAVHMY